MVTYKKAVWFYYMLYEELSREKGELVDCD